MFAMRVTLTVSALQVAGTVVAQLPASMRGQGPGASEGMSSAGPLGTASDVKQVSVKLTLPSPALAALSMPAWRQAMQRAQEQLEVGMPKGSAGLQSPVAAPAMPQRILSASRQLLGRASPLLHRQAPPEALPAPQVQELPLLQVQEPPVQVITPALPVAQPVLQPVLKLTLASDFQAVTADVSLLPHHVVVVGASAQAAAQLMQALSQVAVPHAQLAAQSKARQASRPGMQVARAAAVVTRRASSLGRGLLRRGSSGRDREAAGNGEGGTGLQQPASEAQAVVGPAASATASAASLTASGAPAGPRSGSPGLQAAALVAALAAAQVGGLTDVASSLSTTPTEAAAAAATALAAARALASTGAVAGLEGAAVAKGPSLPVRQQGSPLLQQLPQPSAAPPAQVEPSAPPEVPSTTAPLTTKGATGTSGGWRAVLRQLPLGASRGLVKGLAPAGPPLLDEVPAAASPVDASHVSGTRTSDSKGEPAQAEGLGDSVMLLTSGLIISNATTVQASSGSSRAGLPSSLAGLLDPAAAAPKAAARRVTSLLRGQVRFVAAVCGAHLLPCALACNLCAEKFCKPWEVVKQGRSARGHVNAGWSGQEELPVGVAGAAKPGAGAAAEPCASQLRT